VYHGELDAGVAVVETAANRTCGVEAEESVEEGGEGER